MLSVSLCPEVTVSSFSFVLSNGKKEWFRINRMGSNIRRQLRKSSNENEMRKLL
jgi:hypothetical protein